MEYNRWIYDLNSKKFITIEALDENNERVYIKFEPIKPTEPVIVANILDKPDEVQWTVKGSHIEVIDPTGQKSNYCPAAAAGSMSVDVGQTMLSKLPSSKVYVFPLNNTDSQKILSEIQVVGHLASGSTFSVNVDAPVWIGYVSTDGNVSKVE